MTTTTIYITAYWSEYSREFNYSAQGYPPSDSIGYILIEAREIEFEPPSDAALRLRVADALRGKKNKILADAHVESIKIDETIQQLLSLEYKPADFPDDDDDLPF